MVTCGKGPQMVSWVLRNIKYSKWTLWAQMFTGVCCFIVFVFSTLAAVISVSNLQAYTSYATKIKEVSSFDSFVLICFTCCNSFSRS